MPPVVTPPGRTGPVTELNVFHTFELDCFNVPCDRKHATTFLRLDAAEYNGRNGTKVPGVVLSRRVVQCLCREYMKVEQDHAGFITLLRRRDDQVIYRSQIVPMVGALFSHESMKAIFTPYYKYSFMYYAHQWVFFIEKDEPHIGDALQRMHRIALYYNMSPTRLFGYHEIDKSPLDDEVNSDESDDAPLYEVDEEEQTVVGDEQP